MDRSRATAGAALALVAASVAISPAPQAAVAGDLLLERVGAGQDLVAEIVTAVHQDRAGFLWVGTREGLLRYDGYSITAFEHDASDPHSLSDNTIRVVYEDREGRLWVGTNTGGLNLLDRKTGHFRRYRHDSADPHSISHDSVYGVLQDRSGVLWVGTQSGLNRFDPATGAFERLMADASDPRRPSHDYVNALHEDRQGGLWVATVGGGLNRWDPATGGFTRYRHDAADPDSISDDQVFAITEDAQGGLWFGTLAGLDRLLDLDRGTFRRFQEARDVPGGLSYGLVTSLAPGPAGKLYAGTWRGGVNELDVASGTFRVRRGQETDEKDAVDRVVCLHAGRDGAVWVGTWGAGLHRLRTDSLAFETIGEGAAEQGLSFRDATSVHESRDGTLWIGTFGSGLNRRSPHDRGFRRYLALSNGTTVLALEEGREGRLWLGTMAGLLGLDPVTDDVVSLAHDPSDAHGLGPGYVTALFEDREGRLWVGTGGGGLHRLRDDGRSFERYTHDPQDPATLGDDYVTVLYEDRRGTLWVGTRSGGLDACELPAVRCVRYVPDAGDERSLSHHYITALLEDRAGRLWVGTGGGGLNRVEPALDQERLAFSRITERDGLVDDNVMALVEDDDGSLWISTRGGLTRFDPASGQFASYGPDEGLPTLEFNPGAAAAGKVSLYFGSPAGVVVVPRGMPFARAGASPTAVTSLRTFGQGTARRDGRTHGLDRLDLPYGEVVTLEFAVLDFDPHLRHRYAYRLAEQEAWTDLGSSREITFTDLRPGRYALVARGRNAHGVWSETEPPLRLRIVPPFWMTWWFRLAVLGTVGVALFAGHRARTVSLERRNRELLALQARLEQALVDVRASEERVQTAYHELRLLTGRLDASKEEERKRIARELHDEMGQVLSATKINLQLASLSDEPECRRRIVDGVALVDRMLGHVRALSLDLRPALFDEIGLVPALQGYAEALSRQSGIGIHVDADHARGRLPAETEIQVFRLVQESLTNVLRHSGASSAWVALRREGQALHVTIRDDGRGFLVEEALARAGRGGHLGLLGMRERVHSLGGEMEIDSAPGRGTEVRIRVVSRGGEE